MNQPDQKKVRVRFAPSPTGYLHVGGARTALYCYLFAKNKGGSFVLRVEDTDQERSTEDSLRLQLKDLTWLGLSYDEGVDPETLQSFGDHGPYRQSERLHIYKEHAEKLIKSGHAYYCFLTDEEITQQREQAEAEKRPPHVRSPYKDWPVEKALAEIEKGKKASIRFKVPSQTKDYVVKDLVRGEVTFPSNMVGDFVILRASGMPVYNFCCVIDDALMKMTHVFRAEEHLSNTLRQLMIYEALNYEAPHFGHLSIILGPDRQKLSKRHGATSVNEYRERGYLPEAINNFMALLGWSSPKAQEILTMEELVDQFSLDRLNPASAVFDEVKLKWVNSQHLRALPNQELWANLKPLFEREGFSFPEDEAWQNRSLEVFKTSMEVLEDAIELYRPLSIKGFQLFCESKDTLSWPKTKEVISKWKSLVEAHPSEYIEESQFLDYQNKIKEECGVKGKELFMPIRVAIIGKPQGAELKILVPLLKKETLIERADQVWA